MKKILLQFDTDAHASSFDAITAIDAGVDQLLQYPMIDTSNVTPLVQGGIFTRGPKDLRHTAIFVGGSDVEIAQEVFAKIQQAFFGPMRVSVIMDANGCNTTAAAAVVYVQEHVPLSEVKAVVLGGTGPVGRRVAEILVRQGADVTVVSRKRARAEQICGQMLEAKGKSRAAELPTDGDFRPLLSDRNVVVAAGAAGAEFLTLEQLGEYSQLQLAIDLNAVPPLGIRGVESTDKARKVGGLTLYGAVGIGGLKMKIHRNLVDRLFSASNLVFDTAEIFAEAVKMRQLGITG